jgi:hypothetical protein
MRRAGRELKEGALDQAQAIIIPIVYIAVTDQVFNEDVNGMDTNLTAISKSWSTANATAIGIGR